MTNMMTAEPDYGSAVGLIGHLTTDELRDMHSNSDKVTALVKDLPQLKQLGNEKETFLAKNKSLAEYNLMLEPKLSEAKQNLIAKYEEAATLSDEVKTLKTEIDTSEGQYKPDTLQALLQTAAHEIEEEAENLVKSFLAKEQDVEEFLSEFLSKRKTAHLRRIKADKIGDIISQGGNSAPPYPSQGGNSAPLPYPSQPVGGYNMNQWGSPYPTQPLNMPMPGFH